MNAGEIPDANGERRGLELHPVLRMQGRLVIRRQNDVEVSACGQVFFQDSERSVKILQTVGGDDHVEIPRDRSIFRPNVFMPSVADAGLADGYSGEIKTCDAAPRR